MGKGGGMRIFNPYIRRIDAAKNDHGSLRKKRWLQKGKEFAEAFHRYELTIGGERTGEGRDMTGREGKLENLALQQNFVEAVRLGKPNGERLHRWELIERFIDGKEAK